MKADDIMTERAIETDIPNIKALNALNSKNIMDELETLIESDPEKFDQLCKTIQSNTACKILFKKGTGAFDFGVWQRFLRNPAK